MLREAGKPLQAVLLRLRQHVADERAAIEAELAGDPLAQEPEEGLGKARIAFGPFLVLATLELLVFGDVILTELQTVLVGA